MSAVWGNNLKITLFGESHGPGIGIVIDGLPAGFAVDWDEVLREMARRAPGKDGISTPRREADQPEILSGFLQGRTTGAPLCAMIRNTNTRSGDYGELADKMRPGHADYPAQAKFGGFQDIRGGGHFSGRLTAPIVLCGALVKQILAQQGIAVGAHLYAVADVTDQPFDVHQLTPEQFRALSEQSLPFLCTHRSEQARQRILQARQQGDSVGGVIECAVIGLKAGIGDPFFDSVESLISHLVFSIPGVKGVEFGTGFALSGMTGSPGQ